MGAPWNCAFCRALLPSRAAFRRHLQLHHHKDVVREWEQGRKADRVVQLEGAELDRRLFQARKRRMCAAERRKRGLSGVSFSDSAGKGTTATLDVSFDEEGYDDYPELDFGGPLDGPVSASLPGEAETWSPPSKVKCAGTSPSPLPISPPYGNEARSSPPPPWSHSNAEQSDIVTTGTI